MVGATYGAVPLYRLFCQATGFGGTVRSGATVEEKLALRRRARAGDRKARAEAAEGSSEEAPRPASRPAPREITVTFNADVADGLPWRFSPAQRAVVVRPGQSALAFFTARNLGERPVTGVSTYNVAPQQAGAHFNKVQCFCFEEQRLQPGVSSLLKKVGERERERRKEKETKKLTSTFSFLFQKKLIRSRSTCPCSSTSTRRSTTTQGWPG